MRSLKSKVLSGILCGALVLGLVPGFGMKVNAEEGPKTIYASEQKEGTTIETSEDTILVMDKDLKLTGIYGNGSNKIEIKGEKKLDVVKNLKSFDTYIQNSGTDVTVRGDDFWNKNIEIKSGANLTLTNEYPAGDCVIECKYLTTAGNINVTSETECAIFCSYKATFSGGTTRITTSDRNAIEAAEIVLSGKQYIKTPEGGKIGELEGVLAGGGTPLAVNGDKLVKSNAYSILDKDGNAAKNVVITDKAEEPAPEKATEDVTPTKEDNSSKKTYKNEWVNGQWYDADGKTSYKYKGSWKKDSIGWWYEDENGWFPTSRWQKIDGDWYYFDDIGYMAENEYAGGWEQYSEGHWWVGADGAWDGSEPGVWRLVGTKWWFKDSTGWYAKGKSYKIGGKWYEFDNDGWWIEK